MGIGPIVLGALSMKPLDGISVLDLTRLLPGALATEMLANFGAEVIKVEEPGSGDYARRMPPLIDGQGAYFLLSNSGKKSLAVNLKDRLGREVFLRLAAQADILVEGFRPGVMDRLALGYAQASQNNPRLIYVSISGYGQDGPYASRPGHDLNYLALGGVLHALGGSAPCVPGVQIADVAGATYAVVGVLLALAARQQTGQGQRVDVAMLESILPLLTIPLAEYLATGKIGGSGILLGRYACYNVYEARDGRWLTLGAVEEKFWTAFCKAAGCERFVEHQFVEERQPELINALSGIFKGKSASEWMEFFHSIDTCIAPLNGVQDVLRDPHLIARRTVVAAAWETTGTTACATQFGVAPRLSATPGEVGGAPPALGANTNEVLQRLGYSAEKIREMAGMGIIEIAGKQPASGR